jgi:hypothetical protein
MVGFAPKPKNGSKSTRSAISGRVSIILSIFNTGFAILGCRNTMIPILIPMTVAEKRAILNIYKCSNVRMVNICESHTSALGKLKDMGESLGVVMEADRPVGLFFLDNVLLKLI